MCDITNLFKAINKTMKLTDKSITHNKSLLKSSKAKSEFACSAKQVISLITKLRDFIYDNRKDYLDSVSFLGIRQSKISDLDRDKIDTEAEIFMKTCQDAINSLSILVQNQPGSPQEEENNYNILSLLEYYLIEVCKMYSEQKSLRVNQLIDKKKISKLEPDAKLLKKYPDLFKIDQGSTNTKKEDITLSLSKPSLLNDEKSVKSIRHKSIMIGEESQILNGDEQMGLTLEEKVMLQLENERLYNEMSGMVDELKQIESKIVEISKLQEIFTENVLQQEKEIYRVADTVVGTTENVKGANEEIRAAMKNKAGILVWILFFVIVNTFSLLFLDWYND